MSQTLEQSIAAWAQVAIAVVLLIGVAIVPVAIGRTNRRAGRQEAVLHYLERHDRDSFSQLLSWARGIATLRHGEGPDDAAQRYGRLSDYQRDQLWRVLDFWEETSQVYVNGLFDESVFRGTLGPWLVESWLESRWLIEHLRAAAEDGGDLPLFTTWETVYARMVKAGIRHRRAAETGAATEVIGVGATSSREDWSSLPSDASPSTRGR